MIAIINKHEFIFYKFMLHTDSTGKNTCRTRVGKALSYSQCRHPHHTLGREGGDPPPPKSRSLQLRHACRSDTLNHRTAWALLKKTKAHERNTVSKAFKPVSATSLPFLPQKQRPSNIHRRLITCISHPPPLSPFPPAWVSPRLPDPPPSLPMGITKIIITTPSHRS